MVEIVLALAGLYVAFGALFAVAFHSRLARVDPGVKGAGLFFRLLITPGIVALWPWMALRRRSATPVDPRRPLTASGLRSMHRRTAYLLMVLVPLALALALALRPAEPEPSVALPAELFER